MLDVVLLGAELLALILALAVLAIIFLGVPFWLFHFWMNFPGIGGVARDARMAPPTNEKANRRLDRLFRRYYKRIADLPPLDGFERARLYLFLAGDSETKPMPASAVILLIAFLAADAASFAYLLGGRFNAEASDDQVTMLAAGIVALLIALLAIFGHLVGRLLRRTKTLRDLEPDLLDPDRNAQGERSTPELTSRVRLDEDQDRDKPIKQANDSQRARNRIASKTNDRGGYLGVWFYSIFVAALAIAQFCLRTVSQAAVTTLNVTLYSKLSAPLTANGSADEGALIANITFVIIFVATQIYAVRMGYQHTFVAVEGKRAYQRLRGADTYADIEAAYNAKVRTADETTANLLARYKRYRDVDPDDAMFLERVAREKALAKTRESGGDNSPPTPSQEALSNVAHFPVGEGSGK